MNEIDITHNTNINTNFIITPQTSHNYILQLILIENTLFTNTI